MEAQLRPHQIPIVDEAIAAYQRGRRYKPLFDDGGCGKTWMYGTIATRLAPLIQARTGKLPTAWLVSIKKGKNQQWEELHKIDPSITSPLDVIVVEGDGQERKNLIALAKALRPKWVLLHWEQLRLHPEELWDAIDPACDMVIADESDFAQNPESERSKVIRALSARAHYRIVATGSPFKRSVESLYQQVVCCDPARILNLDIETPDGTVVLPVPTSSAFWGTHGQFVGEFAYVDERGNVAGFRNKPELNRRLLAFGASLTEIGEVVDVPMPEPEVILRPLTPMAWEAYAKLRGGIVEWIENESYRWRTGGNAERVVLKQQLRQQIQKARRLVSLPVSVWLQRERENYWRKLDGEGLGTLQPSDFEQFADGSCAKIEWLNEYLDEWTRDAPGGVLVYSEWTDPLNAIEASLNGTGERLGLARIDGTRSERECEASRMAVLNGQAKLCLATSSGARSLNLQRLNTLVVMTLPWTWAEVEQALWRIYRDGQENEVRLYYVVASGTIDEKRLLPRLVKRGRETHQVKFGQRGKRHDPLFGISGLEDVISWL